MLILLVGRVTTFLLLLLRRAAVTWAVVCLAFLCKRLLTLYARKTSATFFEVTLCGGQTTLPASRLTVFNGGIEQHRKCRQ